MKRYFLDKPIQAKLLITFLPVMILSVIATGSFSYWSASDQLRKNSLYSQADTTYQTALFLDDKFLTIFEQLVNLEDTTSLRNLLSVNDQGDTPQKFNDIIELHNRLGNVYHTYNAMVDSIYVAFNNGRSFSLQQEYVPRSVSIDLPAWQQRYNTSEKGYYWLNSHKDAVFDTVEDRRVLSSFKMIGTPTSSSSGIVLINLRESYFLEIMQNVKISPNGALALISPDGELFSRTLKADYEVQPDTIADLRQLAGGNGSLTAGSAAGQKLDIAYQTLPLNGWVLAAIVPEKDILAGASRIQWIVLAVTLVILVLVAASATLAARNLSNPIRYLSKQVKRFERGDFSVSFAIDQHNEIGVLATGLTRLSDSVEQLLSEVREEQEQKRKAEMRALQAQIQPHFLYNTLGSIKHLIDLEERERASLMVSALTRYFRIGISKGAELITLAEEIEHVRSYLLILNIRYNQDFDYTIEVEDELLSLRIPKLTLQPIVENAVYHGIKNKRGKGLVAIKGHAAEDTAVLEIYDNGQGILPERLSQLRASLQADIAGDHALSFGLWNAHRRLVLQFGLPYGLAIGSEEMKFTRVTVEMPRVQKEGDAHD
ncbi:sensor histidine kinase [Paenibacillus sp. MMS20-IR301]|uniref:sensor histidine kinase n=1 Tax=Paenibacillus sp. MMS20-IR301 TaxID=2895946 RepID=UPI0028E38EA2|nr:sensor histidine kinase [Paenibacillus sp. MMS20-IR301]WNS43979.1 sensor histidine kinase [Paenibacillus sp. MMS20-IR301]